MNRTLVAYFSITGVTENAAHKLAQAIGADIFEIKPKSSDFLPEEMTDEISGTIYFQGKDITEYDRIFVGLPIWWYAAPTVIHSFLSSYDLSGKILIPFVTSGGGGLDKVRPRLLDCCMGADLREATLLHENMGEEELRAWAERYY